MTHQQPFVHDRCVVLHAPNQWWCSRTGECGGGVDGIYAGDTRVVGRITLRVGGGELEWIGNSHDDNDASAIHHHGVVRVDGSGADPLVTLTRSKSISATAAGESYAISNASGGELRLTVEARMEPEDTPLHRVKAGGHGVARSFGEKIVARGADVHVGESGLVLRWQLVLRPGQTCDVAWELPLRAGGPMATPAGDPIPVPEADGRAGRLLRRGIADLNGLRMTDSLSPSSSFIAAGAPWFFTLFGRDSLVAALLAMPFSTKVAVGTLRTLAARQGTRNDVTTAEQPGKILHEVRSHDFVLDDDHHLPPVYYGSIDATLLWILLLDEVLTSGVPSHSLVDLAAPLEAAARWLLECSDPDEDGLLEYLDESGQGLVNQGWKDSGDSIRRADGTLAPAPVALAEVQAYAYRAAQVAGRVAAALGARVDEAALAGFAARVREQFHQRFWCSDELGEYPALALDGDKNPVDGVASNMGHLVGSGLLSRQQEEKVVNRLLDPSMFSGFGVRTLSTTNAAYWPLRYHGGSVWSHDTGQIIWSLRRAGFMDAARVLATGLLDAAEDFDFRLPELFAGYARTEVPHALPYPASCRPQAWAAATGVVVWQVLRGSADEVA